MSSKKDGGVQEGPLVKMLERQRVKQAAADAAKKLEDTVKEGTSHTSSRVDGRLE
jgi:hypothetical protein